MATAHSEPLTAEDFAHSGPGQQSQRFIQETGPSRLAVMQIRGLDVGNK